MMSRSQCGAAKRLSIATRSRRLATVLLISGGLLAGCTLGHPAPTAAPTPSLSPGASRSTEAPATSPSPTIAPRSRAVDPRAVIRVSDRFTASATFQSASGNLACRFTGGVICRAKSHTWNSPAPQPQPGCPPPRRTSGIQLGRGGLTERSDCYDQAEHPSLVLAYGHGLEPDGVRCISEQRGITCQRTADGVGFSISREKLNHTPWDSPLLRVQAASLDVDSTTVFPAGFGLSFLVGDLADCRLESDLATCLVNSRVSSSPPQNPTCDGDQALTATVYRKGRGQLGYDCRSDANGGQGRVRPGEAVQVGDLRCSVNGSRLRCAHLDGGGHGFDVDASSFRGY